MEINNILVVSPMYKDIQKMIEDKNVLKNFLYLPEKETRETDLIWADAVVAFNLETDFDYSHVKWVHSLGAGVDRFITKKNWDKNVLLTRTICTFGQRIAEYCLSYILKDIQYHDQFYLLKKKNVWQPITPKLLSEQKVIIYGTGEIGQIVAKVLSLFGVEVYGVSLSGRKKAYFKDIMKVDSDISQLNKIDYFINTLPLTGKTENIFNDDFFQSLNHAGFINVGRGACVDDKALLRALNNKKVRFAVLDVFLHEPLSEKHPLWQQPNVFITPHISAVTTPEEGVDCFIETLKNIEQKKPLKNKVDVEKGY